MTTVQKHPSSHQHLHSLSLRMALRRLRTIEADLRKRPRSFHRGDVANVRRVRNAIASLVKEKREAQERCEVLSVAASQLQRLHNRGCLMLAKECEECLRQTKTTNSQRIQDLSQDLARLKELTKREMAASHALREENMALQETLKASRRKLSRLHIYHTKVVQKRRYLQGELDKAKASVHALRNAPPEEKNHLHGSTKLPQAEREEFRNKIKEMEEKIIRKSEAVQEFRRKTGVGKQRIGVLTHKLKKQAFDVDTMRKHISLHTLRAKSLEEQVGEMDRQLQSAENTIKQTRTAIDVAMGCLLISGEAKPKSNEKQGSENAALGRDGASISSVNHPHTKCRLKREKATFIMNRGDESGARAAKLRQDVRPPREEVTLSEARIEPFVGEKVEAEEKEAQLKATRKRLLEQIVKATAETSRLEDILARKRLELKSLRSAFHDSEAGLDEEVGEEEEEEHRAAMDWSLEPGFSERIIANKKSSLRNRRESITCYTNKSKSDGRVFTATRNRSSDLMPPDLGKYVLIAADKVQQSQGETNESASKATVSNSSRERKPAIQDGVTDEEHGQLQYEESDEGIPVIESTHAEEGGCLNSNDEYEFPSDLKSDKQCSKGHSATTQFRSDTQAQTDFQNAEQKTDAQNNSNQAQEGSAYMGAAETTLAYSSYVEILLDKSDATDDDARGIGFLSFPVCQTSPGMHMTPSAESEMSLKKMPLSPRISAGESSIRTLPLQGEPHMDMSCNKNTDLQSGSSNQKHSGMSQASSIWLSMEPSLLEKSETGSLAWGQPPSVVGTHAALEPLNRNSHSVQCSRPEEGADVQLEMKCFDDTSEEIQERGSGERGDVLVHVIPEATEEIRWEKTSSTSPGLLESPGAETPRNSQQQTTARTRQSRTTGRVSPAPPMPRAGTHLDDMQVISPRRVVNQDDMRSESFDECSAKEAYVEPVEFKLKLRDFMHEAAEVPKQPAQEITSQREQLDWNAQECYGVLAPLRPVCSPATASLIRIIDSLGVIRQSMAEGSQHLTKTWNAFLQSKACHRDLRIRERKVTARKNNLFIKTSEMKRILSHRRNSIHSFRHKIISVKKSMVEQFDESEEAKCNIETKISSCKMRVERITEENLEIEHNMESLHENRVEIVNLLEKEQCAISSLKRELDEAKEGLLSSWKRSDAAGRGDESLRKMIDRLYADAKRRGPQYQTHAEMIRDYKMTFLANLDMLFNINFGGLASEAQGNRPEIVSRGSVCSQ